MAADLLDKIHELIGAETVGVDHAAPRGVEGCRPLPGRTDSLAPVVLIGKAAARPAHIGHLQRAKGRHNVGANPACIRDRRIRSNPNAVVESVSEILSKLTEKVVIDLRSRLRYIDGQMRILSGPSRYGANQQQKRNAKESPNSA